MMPQGWWEWRDVSVGTLPGHAFQKVSSCIVNIPSALWGCCWQTALWSRALKRGCRTSTQGASCPLYKATGFGKATGRWSARLWGSLALLCAFPYSEGGSWRLCGCREAGSKVQLLWDKPNLQLPHPEVCNGIRQRFGATAFTVPGEQITHLSAAGQLLCGFSLAHVPLDLHTKGSMARCRSCSLPH